MYSCGLIYLCSVGSNIYILGIGALSGMISSSRRRIRCIFFTLCHLQFRIFIQPNTYFCRLDRGRMEKEVWPTLLHMMRSRNRALDLSIFSPMPYPLGHTLQYLSHPPVTCASDNYVHRASLNYCNGVQHECRDQRLCVDI